MPAFSLTATASKIVTMLPKLMLLGGLVEVSVYFFEMGVRNKRMGDFGKFHGDQGGGT